MFRGLKSKLEKSLNQSGIITTLSKGNQDDDSSGNTRSHQQGDETPVGSKLSSASTSLVDLSEEPANMATPGAKPYLFHQSTPISPDGQGDVVDHMSPAVLNLSNFESVEDLTNVNSSNQHRIARMSQRSDLNANNNSAPVGRSRNSSISSQMSDSYYFTPNSGFVPQSQSYSLSAAHQGPMSDVESVTGEFDDSNSAQVADDRMMELVSREDLMRFYKKMQLKNQKYTGRYSQVVAAYKDLEKERDRLKEVLAKCQDKSFQRINELKEQLGLKDMAMNDVEVNYTMMLQEKDEFIKVLQMQVNILKQKFDSEKLVDLVGEESRPTNSTVKSDAALMKEENGVLKEKVSKMSGLLSNCKASILKHREEIKELQNENQQLKRKAANDQEELESLKVKVEGLVSEMKLQLEKQDSNSSKLVRDFSLLQAEHEALSREAEEAKAERDILCSNLHDASNIRASLEDRLELLNSENCQLRKHIDGISQKLQDEMKKEAAVTQWRDRIIDILDRTNRDQSAHLLVGGAESDDGPDSSRSGAGSNSWFTTDTDQEESSVSGVSVSWCSPDIDDSCWKELEQKLLSFMEDKPKLNGEDKEPISISRYDEGKESLPVVNPPSADVLESLKFDLERANKEKIDLVKSLSTTKMHARVFRNLCECIFKAVLIKKNPSLHDSVLNSKMVVDVAGDLNANVNNNASGSETPESSIPSPSMSSILAVNSSGVTMASCIPEESEPYNLLKITRSWGDQSDQEFGTRHSILTILKDGLGHTMKMLENRKKKKRGEIENVYHLSAVEDLEENAEENPNRNSHEEEGQSSNKELCLKTKSKSSSSTPAPMLDVIREDDEEWETIDEEEEDCNDGSTGYIDDYETLFLGGGQLKNLSIQKLLLNWKTGCEKFEQDVGHSDRPLLYDGSECAPLNFVAKSDDSSHGQNLCSTVPIKASTSLQAAYESLKADQERLLNDYNCLQKDFSANLQSLDELKKKNECISKAFENAQSDLSLEVRDSKTVKEFLENAQSVNSELQQALDSLRQDHLKIQQDLNDVTSENLRLMTEISESNEHFEQLQHDLSTAEVKCSQLQDDLRRLQLDVNIKEQDYAELKDEHDKVLEESRVTEDLLKKNKENASKLQSEQQLLQEDYRNLLEECNQLKVSESDLKRELESLQQSQAGFAETHCKLQDSLAKSRQEATSLASELEEQQKIHNKMVDDLMRSKDICEQLKSEREQLQKSVEELRVELSNYEVKERHLELEVDSLKKELGKEREDRGSTESLLSNFEKTKSELATVREEFDKVQIQLEFLKGNLDKTMDENSALEEKLQAINDTQDEKTTRLESELKEKEEEIENFKNIQKDLEGKLASASSEASAKFQAEEKELQLSISGLKEQLEQSQSEIRHFTASIEEVNVEKLKLITEGDDLTGRLNALQSSIVDLEQRNHRLLSDMESLKASNDLNLKDCEAKHSQEMEISKKDLETSEAELMQLKSKMDFLQQDLMERTDKEIKYEKMLLDLKEEIQNKEKELISIREVLECERTERAKADEEMKQNARIDQERVESLLLDLRQEMTSLKEEKSTNETEMGQLKQQLNESQQQVDSLKFVNEGLKVELEVLKSKSEEKSLEFAKELEHKTRTVTETWKDEVSRMEASRIEELEKLKSELLSKQTSQTSMQEKLEQEKAALENDLQTSTKRIERLLSELDSLRAEEELAKTAAASSESKISDLEREIEEEGKNFKEKEGRLDEQIANLNLEVARLKQLLLESKEKGEQIEEENMRNLKILDDITVEREALEKSYDILKNEKKLVEEEGDSLREKLKKLEKHLDLLQSTLSSDKESLESKLAELTSERDKLRIELENVSRDHQKAFEEKDDLVNEMKAELVETRSKLDLLSDEKVLLESSVGEQKSKALKLQEEILKISEINAGLMSELKANKQHLAKSLAEADQRLLEFKELSEAKIKAIESQLESTASEERQRIEREMSMLKGSVSEMEKMLQDVEEALKTKETEWTKKMNDLKKKAELKFKQLKKQKDEAILSSEGKILDLEKRLSDLKGELLGKDADLERIRRSNLEDVKHLKDLLAEETSKFNSQADHCRELESSLAESKSSLEEIQSLLRETQSRLHDNRSCLDEALTQLEEKREAEAEKSKSLDAASEEVEGLKAEILRLRQDNGVLETKVDTSNRNLREATDRVNLLDRQLELLTKTSEDEKSGRDASVERLDELEKKLSEIEKESETVKRKNQALKLEVKRLRAENETNLKAAELDKNNEIERLKKEYTDEMNEREEDNSAKIKHLLKEFQVKLAEKEKEYQDQFVSSIEKFENENDLRAMDLESLVRELREELQEKEEIIDERCGKIEELTMQIGQLRSAEEWEELTERNVKLESRIKELLNKLEEELRIGELRKVDNEDEDAVTSSKKQQLNGSQLSLESSASSVAPMEFEYLKAVLFKYMTDSADKHTLTRVICRIMKFSEFEESRLMEQWKK